MKKVVTILLLSLLVLITIPAGSAMAYETAPDSVTLESIKWFQNEDGDILCIFHYNIAYSGSYPDIPATYTFEFSLYNASSELIAESHPYVFSAFESNGYGNGVSGFFFDSEDEDIPTWQEASHLKIYGFPAFFESPSSFVVNYVMTSIDYSSEDMAEGVYDYVMDICEDLETAYSDVDLIDGTILSDDGDSYFRNAIPGLQYVCPDLFLIQAYTPEVMETDGYDMSLGSTYAAVIDGTDLERGAERLGEEFGVSGTFVWGIVYFALCIFLVIWTSRKGWGIEIAGLLCFIAGLGFALIIGDLIFTLVMIVALVAAMGIMYVLAYKRA